MIGIGRSHRTAWALTLSCSLVLTARAADGMRAFPGAEGWGAVSKGGRGGKVIHVTNLKDSGPGSLRAALMSKGSRTIVFDVGGTIELQSKIKLAHGNGGITIAGQTAPGGITIVGGSLDLPAWDRVKKHDTYDLIMRHVRLRGIHNSATRGTGGDTLTLFCLTKVIIDHCSFTGSSDETVGANGTREFTFQWCTITEPALYGQGGNQHPEGSHNRAFMVAHNHPDKCSFHHNLITHSDCRNPLIFAKNFEVRNNVIYDFNAGLRKNKGTRSNMVGNYYKTRARFKRVNPFHCKGGSFYFHDNVLDSGKVNVSINDPWTEMKHYARKGLTWSPVPKKLSKPIDVLYRGELQTAKEAFDVVLAKAGAWPRDATTLRGIEETRTRSGSMGLGGPYERFPPRKDGPTSAKFDADRDGMPDAWEKAHGLNPKDPSDRNKIVAKGASRDDRHCGYTWLEHYLNELADSLVGAPATVCKVETEVKGLGNIVCAHSGRTKRWSSTKRGGPREVVWGPSQTFNKGSHVILKALPKTSMMVSAPVVSKFSHWSAPEGVRHTGGTVDGSQEPVIKLVVNQDAKITAHFKSARPQVSSLK